MSTFFYWASWVFMALTLMHLGISRLAAVLGMQKEAATCLRWALGCAAWGCFLSFVQ